MEMKRDSDLVGSVFNRRAALGSAAALAAMFGLAGQTGHASTHGKKVNYSRHSLTGMWLAIVNPVLTESPQFPAPSLFTADGFIIFIFPITDLGPQGTIFQAGLTGTWEPDGPHRGHFTGVQMLSDANGTFTGSVTVDGYPVVSEDGQTFIDNTTEVAKSIQPVPCGSPRCGWWVRILCLPNARQEHRAILSARNLPRIR
jgi:hypothetical protein